MAAAEALVLGMKVRDCLSCLPAEDFRPALAQNHSMCSRVLCTWHSRPDPRASCLLPPTVCLQLGEDFGPALTQNHAMCSNTSDHLCCGYGT